MPVSRASLALLLLAPLSAGAVESLWRPVAHPLSAELAGYAGQACPRQGVPPYSGHLRLESKYDQRDASKSTLRAEPAAESEKIARQVRGYLGQLAAASNHFSQAREAHGARRALACLDQWLREGAQASAFEHPQASGTGVATRKWALAAIASSALRTRALSDGVFRLDAQQQGWLQRLAEQVMAEHQPRRAPGFRHFNNHDYWAAWAVAASGMLLGRDDYLAWADYSLRRALREARSGHGSDYAYLPAEVARGPLAADYSHYALVPLVLLAETAEANGRALSAEEHERLQQLATFAARAVRAPDRLPELDGRQRAVAAHKMTWLLPFLQRYPQHPEARALWQARGQQIDNYDQIGGRQRPLYPPIPAGT